MKEKLKKAIEHAERFLKIYQEIPTGMFGEIMIISKLSEAEEMLENFEKYDESVIQHMIDKLWKIE